ncbi:MAG: DUF86 domain-containing protein [Candidatus Scalindua sediminis]|nr:DUF86 domain-containing protein [Candidatus Scalindua sediminis]HDY67095.1 DUF86 domain-containing protein [Candidatus Scalindua sp.]
MSERDWLLFVKDIHKSITRILEYTNTTKSEFFNDRKTFDAVMRNLEIIGEAVKHIPADVRRKYKSVEWKKIAGLRDIVVHEYFGINEKIIWDVIENKIPTLKEVQSFFHHILIPSNQI